MVEENQNVKNGAHPRRYSGVNEPIVKEEEIKLPILKHEQTGPPGHP